MITAKFINKTIWNIIWFVCGVFLIIFFGYLKLADSEASNNVFGGIVVGVIICIFSIVFLLFNHKAFICADENRLKGKYGWFGVIDCDISDIEFVLSQMNNTLKILLKNGKLHVVAGMENSFEICTFIRCNMPFESSDTTADLIQKINQLNSLRKKNIIFMFGGLALLFINIFITVLLTGGRELNEFSKADTIIAIIMCVAELAVFVITFYFADKAGKMLVPTEGLKYNLRRTIVETRPLPPGYIKNVYTNGDWSARKIVFGNPDETGVYYSLQVVDAGYDLLTVYKSPIYDEEEVLPEDSNCICITDIVYH